MTETSPVLWQNASKTVTVLDLPRSIEAAQAPSDRPRNCHLLSCEPLQSPYPSNEPKSTNGEGQFRANSVEQTRHQCYEDILDAALKEAREHCVREWCYPRPFVLELPRAARKRKRDVIDSSCVREVQNHLPEWLLTSVAHAQRRAELVETRQTSKTSDTDLDPNVEISSSEFYFNDNETKYSTVMLMADTSTTYTADRPLSMTRSVVASDRPAYRFNVPARSSVSLTSCLQSRAFHTHIRNQAQNCASPKHFDFILLDPPWPNRSVKRTHRTAGSTYRTPSTLHDTYELLLGMDVDMLMGATCLVAVWITNKQAIRETVLGQNGLFETWGIDLIEEWLWLKTTVYGEPVSELSAVWRKPYEVLLVGRKRGHLLPCAAVPREELRSRVVISVPDLHSRKPCLKKLIEHFLPEQHRVLEVFARHLVSGWWSWGDECLKFNWQGFWKGDHNEHGTG